MSKMEQIAEILAKHSILDVAGFWIQPYCMRKKNKLKVLNMWHLIALGISSYNCACVEIIKTMYVERTMAKSNHLAGSFLMTSN